MAVSDDGAAASAEPKPEKKAPSLFGKTLRRSLQDVKKQAAAKPSPLAVQKAPLEVGSTAKTASADGADSSKAPAGVEAPTPAATSSSATASQPPKAAATRSAMMRPRAAGLAGVIAKALGGSKAAAIRSSGGAARPKPQVTPAAPSRTRANAAPGAVAAAAAVAAAVRGGASGASRPARPKAVRNMTLKRRTVVASAALVGGAAKLKAASGLAVRRLGMPLRRAANRGSVSGTSRLAMDNEDGIRPTLPKRRSNTLTGPSEKVAISSEGGVLRVKQQVPSSDEEGEEEPSKAVPPRRKASLIPTKLEPKAEPRGGFGYGAGQAAAPVVSHRRTSARNGRPVAAIAAAVAAATSGSKPARGSTVAKDPRSRNLLGTLMGHLTAAKNLLDEQQHPTLRVKAEVAAEEDEESGGNAPGVATTKAHNEEDEDVDEEEEDEQEHGAAAASRDRKAQEKEMRGLRKRLESHYSLMTNFIRTRSEPTIFYLPVSHTSKTERYLGETRMAIQQKIKSLKRQLQVPIKHDDADEEEDEEVSAPPAKKQRKAMVEKDSDSDEEASDDEEDDDDSEEEPPPPKKRSGKVSSSANKRSAAAGAGANKTKRR